MRLWKHSKSALLLLLKSIYYKQAASKIACRSRKWFLFFSLYKKIIVTGYLIVFIFHICFFFWFGSDCLLEVFILLTHLMNFRVQYVRPSSGRCLGRVAMLFMSKQVSLPKISPILQKMKIGQNSIYALFARRPSIIFYFIGTLMFMH